MPDRTTLFPRSPVSTMSSSPIDVAPVSDRLEDDHSQLVVDSVDDPVVATASAVPAFQFEAQWTSDVMRILSQRSVGQFNCGRCHLLREPLQRAGR